MRVISNLDLKIQLTNEYLRTGGVEKIYNVGLLQDLIDYQLTGRNWLGFNEAIYYFEEVNENSCKLTRITTYTSMLKPRFYWKPLEKTGIKQEHDYVF